MVRASPHKKSPRVRQQEPENGGCCTLNQDRAGEKGDPFKVILVGDDLGLARQGLA